MRRAFILALAAGFAALADNSVSADAPFRIVVHPQVKGTQIPRSALSSIFLKQAPRWSDGSPVLPIDQSVQSPVRQKFSNEILQQGVVAVQVYWQRKMSSGMTPPPVKTSDEDVLSYVASTPGAIGYVSAATPLPDSVKPIEVMN